MRRNVTDADLMDVAYNVKEADYALAHLDAWMEPQRVHTPLVLELGGKNPTIVHASTDLRSAARRIAYGRFINSGHICTAPDHVLVWPEVKDEFVRHLVDTIREFYGDDPQKSPDYGRVINQRNFDRTVERKIEGRLMP